MKLNKSIALVTGASSGIGKATAERLATAGYKVYGTSRRGAPTGQRPFEMLPLDVTSDESVTAAVADVIRLDGRIDLLVNNAGFGVAAAGAEESSIGQAQAIFDTNFFGIVRMTHAVAGYSEALDHELRTMGIRVSVVEPAYINTPFDANLMKPDAPLEVYREVRAGVERRVKEVLVGSDGPEVVAEIVLKAAMAHRPKIRYAPGVASRMRLLRGFAPAGVLDAGVRKDLRLEA